MAIVVHFMLYGIDINAERIHMAYEQIYEASMLSSFVEQFSNVVNNT